MNPLHRGRWTTYVRDMGSVTGRTLGLRSDDPVLSWIGSLGLALAAPSCLVVDLVGPFQPGGRSLGDLYVEGPRLDEISPARVGAAVVPGGDLDAGEVEDAVGLLARSWPRLVVRSDGIRWLGATVPYAGLYPGALAPTAKGPAVWQRLRGSGQAPGPGPVLPRIGSATVRLLLDSKRPPSRRWIKSWGRVWAMPWG